MERYIDNKYVGEGKGGSDQVETGFVDRRVFHREGSLTRSGRKKGKGHRRRIAKGGHEGTHTTSNISKDACWGAVERAVFMVI